MLRRWLCLALVPLAAAACGGDGDTEEDQGLTDTGAEAHVAISLTAQGCLPAETTVRPGRVTFDVTNEASEEVTEFAVLRPDDSVVGEVENVGIGKTETLTLDLDEGEYVTQCPNGNPERGVLHVGNADSGEHGTTTLDTTAPGGAGDEAETGHS